MNKIMKYNTNDTKMNKPFNPYKLNNKNNNFYTSLPSNDQEIVDN